MKGKNKKDSYLAQAIKNNNLRDVLVERKNDKGRDENVFDKNERYAEEVLKLEISKPELEVEQARLKYNMEYYDNLFNSINPLLIIISTLIVFNVSLSSFITEVKQPTKNFNGNKIESNYDNFLAKSTSTALLVFAAYLLILSRIVKDTRQNSLLILEIALKKF
jgi:hypothetical protein